MDQERDWQVSDFGKKVTRILDEASAVYADRNAVYKDNFRNVGNVMVALFPNGRPALVTAEDFNRWHIFELLIVKLTRYANGYDSPDEDSILDMIPYEGILGALDAEMREKPVVHGDIVRHTAWPKYPAVYGVLPCSMCSGRVTRESANQEWRHEDQGRDPAPLDKPHLHFEHMVSSEIIVKENRRADAQEDLDDLLDEDEVDDLLDDEY